MRIYINRLPSSHGRGGLEGDRPSSSPDHYFASEVQHFSPARKGQNRIVHIYLPSTCKRRKYGLYLSLNLYKYHSMRI